VRPTHHTLDSWLVVGACVASIGNFVLRDDGASPLTRIGFENPIVRVLALWLVAVATQFVGWYVWRTIRRRG